MNKKHFNIVLIITIALVIFFTSRTKTLRVPIVVDTPLSSTNPYCFTYTHTATTDAPYTVEEHLKLTRIRGDITGTKSGTQSGPDMTNAYEGTMKGEAKDGYMEFVYSYTIEGSAQKEVERYVIDGANLIKERYVLKEEKRNGETVLVPDLSSPVTNLIYTAEKCT